MNILFVALEFPPLGGIPIRRSMAFVRNLPEFGITPIVVTTDRASLQRMFHTPIDETGMSELAANLRIERIPGTASVDRRGEMRLGRFARSLTSFAGDPHAGSWGPAVRREIGRLVREHSPAAIYVSIPPFSMAPLWAEISREAGIPLILDFRDAWSQLGIGAYWSRWHYQITLGLERRALKAAARVVCSTPEIMNDLIRVHPRMDRRKLSVIFNGYEKPLERWAPLGYRCSSDRPFTVGYLGSFYYTPEARRAVFDPWWRKRPHQYFQYSPRREDWLYRSPYFFFRAVHGFLRDRPELRPKLRIRFAGVKPRWLDAQIAEFGLADIVESVGYLSHAKAIEFQGECDALLVTSAKVLDGRDYSIAGKTFEYFEAGKPILAFVAEGAQRDLLLKSGLAVVCDPDDESDAIARLAALIDGRVQLRPNDDFLHTLHRRVLTRQLAAVIGEAAGRAPGDSERLRPGVTDTASVRHCSPH